MIETKTYVSDRLLALGTAWTKFIMVAIWAVWPEVLCHKVVRRKHAFASGASKAFRVKQFLDIQFDVDVMLQKVTQTGVSSSH